MLAIKLTARDVKGIRGMVTPDFDWLYDLITKRIDEAEVAKTMKSGKAEYRGPTWKDAENVLRAILGADLKMPPEPTQEWYIRQTQRIRNAGMSPGYIAELGDYVKANLRPPYGFDFLIGQHLNIMAGRYNSKETAKDSWKPGNPRAYIEEKLA